MITSEELEFLRKRATHLICHLCGLTMQEVQGQDGKNVLRCYNSTERKYSTEWWNHVSLSTTPVGKQRDEMVMKLIESFKDLLEEFREYRERRH